MGCFLDLVENSLQHTALRGQVIPKVIPSYRALILKILATLQGVLPTFVYSGCLMGCVQKLERLKC